MTQLLTDYALVTDIGGTNARFALFNIQTGELSAITKIEIDPDHDLLTLIKNYIESQSVGINSACIAIACPIDGTDRVEMTNNSLSFSRSQLIAALNLKRLEVINDFTAVSFSVPQLTQQDYVKIDGGDPNEQFPIAIYGAGTGLGVSHLIKYNNQWISLSGEGGHVELPMTNEIEDKVLIEMRKKYGRVSAERFLSGRGIVNIYNALLSIHNRPQQELTPDIIVERALTNSCNICHQTLTLFCTFMGRFGGNLALTLNTQGGVYIAGGIVPRFIEFFKASPFRAAFENKGRMSYLLKKIPVYLITHSDPGLLGAGIYLRNSLNLK
ncbi:glucokinase [Orbaceae bacterium ESL0721]|nr:glucokinase [Orbaceae bacterium ESL0721]